MSIRDTIAVLIAGLLSTGAVFADGAADQLSVMKPAIRATAPGQQNSAVFMHLSNEGDKALRIVAAESDLAGVVELHTNIREGEVMKMRRVDDIEVPAKGEVMLQPGGLHVMLIGLKSGLAPGEEHSVTLVLDDGSRKTITAPVQKIKMKMMHKGGHGHGG